MEIIENSYSRQLPHISFTMVIFGRVTILIRMFYLMVMIFSMPNPKLLTKLNKKLSIITLAQKLYYLVKMLSPFWLKSRNENMMQIIFQLEMPIKILSLTFAFMN